MSCVCVLSGVFLACICSTSAAWISGSHRTRSVLSAVWISKQQLKHTSIPYEEMLPSLPAMIELISSILLHYYFPAAYTIYSHTTQYACRVSVSCIICLKYIQVSHYQSTAGGDLSMLFPCHYFLPDFFIFIFLNSGRKYTAKD